MRIDREQLLRLATFWLRPDFILRVAARFQKIAGFDRAIALASSALTALIPLTIFVAAILPGDGSGSADRIVRRYDLTGKGAAAVQDAFAPSADIDTRIGFFGAILLLVAVLSFTRAAQRLFEQTWELPSLSVRNTLNGLKWVAGLVLYTTLIGKLHGAIDRGLAELIATFVLTPLSVGFFVWSGWVLSAKRIAVRDLLPFGVVGALMLALYQVGAAVYVPHMFNTYAGRYGVIGAVFAMISALFGLMVAVVGSAAFGREVRVELDNIRDGIRPSDDEVRKQWDIIIAQTREYWAQAREQYEAFRERRAAKRRPPSP